MQVLILPVLRDLCGEADAVRDDEQQHVSSM
jgi:hypothetical protein